MYIGTTIRPARRRNDRAVEVVKLWTVKAKTKKIGSQIKHQQHHAWYVWRSVNSTSAFALTRKFKKQGKGRLSRARSDAHATEFFSQEVLCLRKRISFAIAAEPLAVRRESYARRHSNSRFAIVPRREEGAESEVAPADV
jgi:hypothetical protein